MKVSIDSKTAQCIEEFCKGRYYKYRWACCNGCPYHVRKVNQEQDSTGWFCIFSNQPSTWSWSESA